MSIQRITAIVPADSVGQLETRLRACGVPGITVEYVQGYGKHPNFFRRDLMKNNARIVIYADEASVDGVVDAIVNCTHEVGSTAGILAVETIDRLVNLADGAEVVPKRI